MDGSAMIVTKIFELYAAAHNSASTEVMFTVRRRNDPMIVPMNNLGATTENQMQP